MSEHSNAAPGEVAELRIRLRELEDTLHAIHSGDVDALVVNDDIYTIESAHAATNRLRQDVLGQMQDAVFAFDLDDHVMYVNPAAERRYGVDSSEVLGRLKSEVFSETVRPGPGGNAAGGHGNRDGSGDAGPRRDDGEKDDEKDRETIHHLASGSSIYVESVVSRLIDSDGQCFGTLAVIRDVTQRRRAEQRRDALARLTDTLRDLDESSLIGFEAARILGQTLEVGRCGYGSIDHETETLRVERDWSAPGIASLGGSLRLRELGSFVEDLKRNRLVEIADVRRDPRTEDAAVALGELKVRSFVSVPIVEFGRLVATLYLSHSEVRHWSDDDIDFVRDVAERTRIVVERARNAQALRDSQLLLRAANENLEAVVEARTRELMAAEEALRQAQKMEAVGQLTGGIAHDFNNLLGAVSASLQVLQARLRQGKNEGLERYITLGQDSIRRASALTQRLLAFARRQTLAPKPTDLNRLILGMEDLIRRSVGPNVAVEVVGSASLWLSRIDPSQLENSLLNLCINARDAMAPGGGRLTIETANKWLDSRAAAERGLSPGQYVSLCVTDTGTGMSASLIEHIFDPFFTTKPTGQGTGLGLSMVYGFVRQSGGQVRVYSELGKGTTMCLYLPRHMGPADVDETPNEPALPVGGDGETVLVVEDEETIRLLIEEVLVEAGYKVLTAEDGAAGLRVLQSPRRIDLLLTDVGLPGGLNGRQVADAARQLRPNLKVLFVTGYAENAALGNGLLGEGMEVLTKPFEISILARKVREMSGS